MTKIRTYFDTLPESDIKEEFTWGAISEAAPFLQEQ